MWWGELVQVALTGIKSHPGSLLEAVTLGHEIKQLSIPLDKGEVVKGGMG